MMTGKIRKLTVDVPMDLYERYEDRFFQAKRADRALTRKAFMASILRLGLQRTTHTKGSR